MYTVSETYEEIKTMDCTIVCDKTFHNIEGEVRVICWETLGETNLGDKPLWVVRSWANNVWHDTQFTFNPEKAAVLVDAFEYGV